MYPFTQGSELLAETKTNILTEKIWISEYFSPRILGVPTLHLFVLQ